MAWESLILMITCMTTISMSQTAMYRFTALDDTLANNIICIYQNLLRLTASGQVASITPQSTPQARLYSRGLEKVQLM